jgi:hypothetical protein
MLIVNKTKFVLSVLALTCITFPVLGAKISLQPVNNNLTYSCPFDVDVWVDAEGESLK